MKIRKHVVVGCLCGLFAVYTFLFFVGVRIPWFVLWTVPLLAFRCLKLLLGSSLRLKRFFGGLGKVSLYIYLIHPLVFQAIVLGAGNRFDDSFAGGIAVYLLTLSLSWVGAVLMRRLPLIGKP